MAAPGARAEEQPILTDGIVWLTPWHEHDASAFGDFNLDPDHARWFDQPAPEPDPERRREHHIGVIRRYRDEWTSGASFSFALRAEPEGAVVGAADLQPRPPIAANIAYAVTAGHRRRGYATRAVRLLAEAGLTRFGFHRIQLICDVENAPSRRVAEKTGFTFEGIQRGSGWFEHVVEFAGTPRDQAAYSLIASDLGQSESSPP